jgi:hypothetical protein
MHVLLVAAFAACVWASPAVAEERPITAPVEAVSTGTPIEVSSDTFPDPVGAASGATGPVQDILPTPTPSVPDTSGATGSISDTISGATDAVSGATSGGTDAVSGATSGGIDAVSGGVAGAAAEATGPGVDHDVGVAATSGGRTSAREGGSTFSCDPGTTCVQGAQDGGPLSQMIERIFNFLAQTGFTLLPWIAIAVALTVLGAVLLRASRRRTSRT